MRYEAERKPLIGLGSERAGKSVLSVEAVGVDVDVRRFAAKAESQLTFKAQGRQLVSHGVMWNVSRAI